jgi:hypothetical protein
MNKKTKMYVGVAVVAAAAYYFYMQSKKKETTTTAPATKSMVGFAMTDSTGQSKNY